MPQENSLRPMRNPNPSKAKKREPIQRDFRSINLSQGTRGGQQGAGKSQTRAGAASGWSESDFAQFASKPKKSAQKRRPEPKSRTTSMPQSPPSKKATKSRPRPTDKEKSTLKKTSNTNSNAQSRLKPNSNSKTQATSTRPRQQVASPTNKRRPPRTQSNGARPPTTGVKPSALNPRQTAQTRRPTNGQARPPVRKPGTAGRPRSTAGTRRPKRSQRANRAMMVLGLFATGVIFFFIVVSLVFKIDGFEISGETVYSDDEIVNATGFKTGDNLFFLSTKGKEEELTKKLPFIAKVTLKKQIPNKLIIEVVPARIVASIEVNGAYISIDDTKKIVQIGGKVDGAITVLGLTPKDPVVSEPLTFEKEETRKMFADVMDEVLTMDAVSEYKEIDFSDITNISMNFEDRIFMTLGNTEDLTYKVHFGTGICQDEINKNKKANLDMSVLKDTNAGRFTETGKVKELDDTAEPDKSSSSPPKQLEFKAFASNPGRGEDIPDKPYTGIEEDTTDTDTANTDVTASEEVDTTVDGDNVT